MPFHERWAQTLVRMSVVNFFPQDRTAHHSPRNLSGVLPWTFKNWGIFTNFSFLRKVKKVFLAQQCFQWYISVNQTVQQVCSMVALHPLLAQGVPVQADLSSQARIAAHCSHLGDPSPSMLDLWRLYGVSRGVLSHIIKLGGHYKVLLNKDHTTCGKERFIGPDHRAVTLRFRVRWLGWKWVVGFIGGAKPWGRERVSGLWLSTITRWNRSTCLASWVTGNSWVVSQAKKQSGREKQLVINQGSGFRC
jgi:hypothetical protein